MTPPQRNAVRTNQRSVTPHQQPQYTESQRNAARTIQRIVRGSLSRSALRTGSMRRTVTKKRTAILPALASLPLNMKRTVLKSALPRVPGSFSKKHAPKAQLSPNTQRWLRLAHRNVNNFPSTANYDQYIQRVHRYTHQPRRQSLTKAILARYELLQVDPRFPTSAVARSPTVKKWRNRIHANFNRKYTRRHPTSGRLSSRELYGFLQTQPLEYLHRTARNAPTYA